MTLKVLLTSAGAKIPLLKALKQAATRLDADATVIAGDLSDQVVSAYLADEFWAMPPTHSDKLAALLQGCIDRKITHILPSRDGELAFWADYQSLFTKKGIQVLVAPKNAVSLCLDKLAFAHFAEATGANVIATQDSLSALDAPILVVKERFGAGSQSIGLKLDRSAAAVFANRLTRPVFQPYIAGKEISIDAWLDHQHHLKGHICRYREKICHGESQITSTVALPQFDEQIRKLLEGLQLTGPVVLQGIIDAKGKLHIIECNSRFGGASTLGIRAGLDSLYWSLAQSQGEDISALPFVPREGSLTQVRYPLDMYL